MKENVLGVKDDLIFGSGRYPLPRIIEREREKRKELKKEYGKVGREGLWIVLYEYGVEQKLVMGLNILHEGCKLCVK